MKQLLTVFLFLMLTNIVVFAGPEQVMENIPLFSGNEPINPSIKISTYVPGNRGELDEMLGDTVHVGYSIYDFQHNGTVSRMIVMTGDEESEMAHVVWMRLIGTPADDRNVYYTKAWYDEDGNPQLSSDNGGHQVDTGNRAGYTCLAGLRGTDKLVPAYHTWDVPQDVWLATEYDILPGVFITYQIPDNYPTETRFSWPHADMGSDSIVHVVVNEIKEEPAAEAYLLYYRVRFDAENNSFTTLNDDQEPVVITTHAMNLTSDISVSDDGERVAVTQTVSRDYVIHDMDLADVGQANNDVYLFLSEDGGETWNDPVNLTDFIEPDTDLFPDSVAASQDTLRGYTDTNVYFDSDDILHVAFAASGFTWYHPGRERSGVVMSKIFHWDEVSDVWTQVADGYFFNGHNPGTFQSMACRPSMAQDDETGHLFCAFQQYGEPGDTMDYSTAGRPNSEIFIAGSPYGSGYGRLWTEPVNLTNTRYDQPGGGAAYDCKSEKDVSLALHNPGEYLNLNYMDDQLGGSAVREEGEYTSNPVVWHRVHKDSLIDSFTGWLPNFPLHIDETKYWEDSLNYEWEPWGFDGRGGGAAVDDLTNIDQPAGYYLAQNYPNPFNPSTKIKFRIAKAQQVRLAIYNTLGQEVQMLMDDFKAAGTYSVEFDGSILASGIYFYRLESESFTSMKKMVIIK
ncbi:MAG: T9SS type A sorting domain-containing protein [Candidatus Electryonea clarkiae]|nr:T9SS type A sorting domain-containing protein [Candidatus Electryonea clarkiae]MDP8288674.1 T9SS type A sorting domain-containing protein [Candidatus Electryonea clarkiae]